jgi:hypothetical protein
MPQARDQSKSCLPGVSPVGMTGDTFFQWAFWPPWGTGYSNQGPPYFIFSLTVEWVQQLDHDLIWGPERRLRDALEGFTQAQQSAPGSQAEQANRPGNGESHSLGSRAPGSRSLVAGASVFH